MVAMFLLIRCINRKTVSDRIRRDLCVLKLPRHVQKLRMKMAALRQE
jgi:hypothetical protein